MRLPRVRFTVQRMMIAVTVLSIPLALWCWRISAGFAFPSAFDVVPLAITIVSAGILVKVLGRGSGLQARGRVLGPIRWGFVLLSAMVSVWFTSVQWDWIEETCASCGHSRSVYENRVFSVTPQRTVVREYPRFIVELVAVDLGIPCAHDRTGRFRMERWLGGCFCVERFRGTYRLSDGPWYPDCARNAVRSWPVNDPGLVQTFRDGIREGKDGLYLRDLVSRMFDACPVEERPLWAKKRESGTGRD
jgi:hypothetical protein